MSELADSNVVKAKSKASNSVLKSRVIAAEEEARAIVTEARNYAEQLILDTELKSQNHRKQAFEDAREAALLELQSKLIKAAEIRDNALVNAERTLLELSVKLAEKILGRELESDPNAVADVVQAALLHARQQKTLTLRVNPSDSLAMQNEIERLKSTAQTKFVDIVADPRVDSGGCLIESEVGAVDARLATQFRVLRKALLSRLEGDAGADHV
jgi:type III secretion protein L